MTNLQFISTKHIILVGFKNVGKSSIGAVLATRLKRPFIDLDDQIVAFNLERTGEKLSCREIMKIHGEEFFRQIERQVLDKILSLNEGMVLALGGGTPMLSANRELMKDHLIVHVCAPKSIVFERIMINGKPAFFPKNKESFDSFQELWTQRQPIFEQMADITVSNKGSIDEAVENIKRALVPKENS